MEWTHLQKRGNGISRDTPVRIGNQVLHVEVASRDRLRVDLGELVERLDSSKFEHRLGRRQEQLQNSDRAEELGRGDTTHFANSASGFNVDHVGLVAQERLEVFVHLLLNTDCQLTLRLPKNGRELLTSGHPP